MAQQLPEIRGRFTVAASAHEINVGTGSNTVTAGTYFTAGVTGETNAYIEGVQSAIRTNPTHGGALVNYYPANGRVTITLQAAASVNMASVVASALGFSSAQRASAATHVGDQVPQHIWRPSRGLSDHPVELNVFYAPRSTTVVGRSSDGSPFSREGNTLYDAEVTFDKLPRADVLEPPSGSIGRDFQSFFEDVIAKGQVVRWIPRREDHSLSYLAVIGSDEADEIGSFQDFQTRHVSSWLALFNVTIPFMKKP